MKKKYLQIIFLLFMGCISNNTNKHIGHYVVQKEQLPDDVSSFEYDIFQNGIDNYLYFLTITCGNRLDTLRCELQLNDATHKNNTFAIHYIDSKVVIESNYQMLTKNCDPRVLIVYKKKLPNNPDNLK